VALTLSIGDREAPGQVAPMTTHILPAFLGLLALATAVHAEDAWMLWEENAFDGPPWRRLELFGTEPECQTGAFREARLTYDKLLRRGTIHSGHLKLEGSRVRIPVDFGDWIVSYECFPDTVDPRGSTGK
jgi:hypothetical protein